MTDTTSKPRVLLSILKGESFDHLPDVESLYTAISAGYGRFECERLLKPSGVELMNLPNSASIEICVMQRDRETGQKHLRYHGLVPLASVHPAFFGGSTAGTTGVPPAPGAGGELTGPGRDSPATWESWLGLYPSDTDLKKQPPDRVFQQCMEMGVARSGVPRLFLRLQYLPPGTSAVQQRTANASQARAGEPRGRDGDIAGTAKMPPPDSTNLNAQAALAGSTTAASLLMPPHVAADDERPGVTTNSRLGQWQAPGSHNELSGAGREMGGTSREIGGTSFPPTRGSGEASTMISSAFGSTVKVPGSGQKLQVAGYPFASPESAAQRVGSRTPIMGMGVQSRSPSRYDSGVYQPVPQTGDTGVPTWLHGRIARGASPLGGRSPIDTARRSPERSIQSGQTISPLPRFPSGGFGQADHDASELNELRQKYDQLVSQSNDKTMLLERSLKDATERCQALERAMREQQEMETRSQQRASETYELRTLVADLRAQNGELERQNLELHQRDLARESVERDFFEQVSPALTSLGFDQRGSPPETASSTDAGRAQFAQVATALSQAVTRKQSVSSADGGTSAGQMLALVEDAVAQAVEGGKPAFEEFLMKTDSRDTLLNSERLLKSCRQVAAMKSAFGPFGKEPQPAVAGSFFYSPVKNDPVDLLIAARFLRSGSEPIVAAAAAGFTRIETGKYSLGPDGPKINCHIDQGHVMVQPLNGSETVGQAAVELGAYLSSRGMQRTVATH